MVVCVGLCSPRTVSKIAGYDRTSTLEHMGGQRGYPWMP